MMMLVMLTLLAVNMFRGYGLQQKISGNTRDKEAAFHAAESAILHAESWISSGVALTTVSCAGNKLPPKSMQVCDTALTDPMEPDNWPAPFGYVPRAMNFDKQAGNSENAPGHAKFTYAKAPSIHIAYLGPTADGQKTLYAVTAVGYGGNGGTDATSSDTSKTGTTSVIQTVYGVAVAQIKELGAP